MSWSSQRDWLMLPANLGHLPASDGIRVRPHQIIGGRRWSLSLFTRMTTADETDLAHRARSQRPGKSDSDAKGSKEPDPVRTNSRTLRSESGDAMTTTTTTTTTTTAKMPELMEDEDGETIYVFGHVDPVQVRVAVALYLLREWSLHPDAAFENAMDATVEQEWWRPAPTPENDEMMARCGPTDEGADPFTVVRGLAS